MPLDNIFSRLGSQWTLLSSGQRVVLLSMIASFAISIIVFSVWVKKPDMAVLAAGMDPSVAGEVVKELDSRGVEYRVENGGTTVLVARNMVSELRVVLASNSVLSGSPVGYELFDNEKIGITEFAQRVNLQRALEGELSRTISELRAVDKARVHLAIPKESVFLDNENKPTAAVIVKLRPGHDLTSRQVQGIANLVSFSIDGLDAAHVSIVDDGGNVLKGQTGDYGGASVAALQDKQSIESYLGQKAETLLGQVVGPGRAKVAVNVTLNWEQVQKTKESYDPAKTVVRSEERNESTSPSDGGTTESVVTNYEVDKTIENVLSAVGTIKNLSVAVFVDHETAMDANGAVTHRPRSADELKQLEQIVKNAVGYDAERGDNISVVNMKFNTERPEFDKPGFLASPLMKTLPSVLGKVAMIIVVVVLLLSVKKNIKLASIPAARPSYGPIIDAQEPQISSDIMAMPDQINRTTMEDQARKVAESNPENVAKLMKTWMVEESSV